MRVGWAKNFSVPGDGPMKRARNVTSGGNLHHIYIFIHFYPNYNIDNDKICNTIVKMFNTRCLLLLIRQGKKCQFREKF